MQIRWVVLVASMWVSWFDFGLQTTLGTFFIPLLDEFGEARSATAVVQSMFVGINQGLGVFVGLLITRFGISKVTLTGSILLPLGFFFCYFSTSLVNVIICISFFSAIGVSLMFVSSAVMLSHVFTQRQLPVAIALHSASISFAGLTYPYIMDYILENFQLHGTFLILSGYLFNNLAISILFSYTLTYADKQKTKRKLKAQERGIVKNVNGRNSTTDFNIIKDTDKNQSNIDVFSVTKNANTSESTIDSKENAITKISVTNDTQITQNEQLKSQKFACTKIARSITDIISVPFVTILMATGIIIASQNGYVSLLIDIFESNGYTHSQALNAFLPLNLCGLAARLLPGFLKNIHGKKQLILAICFTVCGGVGQIMIWLAPNYAMMMIGVGLTGIPMGGVICVASIVVAKLVENQNFPVAFGLILTIIGILASTCGPVYGAIRDFSDSYSTVLIIDASEFCSARERGHAG